MRNLIVTTMFALGLVTSAFPASAQTAYVYAVHGIPGDNGFPVDISVDGVCAVTGFTFGNVGGPLSLAAGAHTVSVYAANTTTPCSGGPALSAPPTLAAGKTYALVAHLTAAGSPTLTGFAVDLSRTAPGNGRFILHHTAAAPEVNVTVKRGEGGGSHLRWRSPASPTARRPARSSG